MLYIDPTASPTFVPTTPTVSPTFAPSAAPTQGYILINIYLLKS